MPCDWYSEEYHLWYWRYPSSIKNSTTNSFIPHEFVLIISFQSLARVPWNLDFCTFCLLLSLPLLLLAWTKISSLLSRKSYCHCVLGSLTMIFNCSYLGCCCWFGNFLALSPGRPARCLAGFPPPPWEGKALTDSSSKRCGCWGGQRPSLVQIQVIKPEPELPQLPPATNHPIKCSNLT